MWLERAERSTQHPDTACDNCYVPWYLRFDVSTGKFDVVNGEFAVTTILETALLTWVIASARNLCAWHITLGAPVIVPGVMTLARNKVSI